MTVKKKKSERVYKHQLPQEDRRGAIISFTASPALINLTTQYCLEQGITRSELIRELLVSLLENHYAAATTTTEDPASPAESN